MYIFSVIFNIKIILILFILFLSLLFKYCKQFSKCEVEKVFTAQRCKDPLHAMMDNQFHDWILESRHGFIKWTMKANQIFTARMISFCAEPVWWLTPNYIKKAASHWG